jgi:uncharacterized protein
LLAVALIASVATASCRGPVEAAPPQAQAYVRDEADILPAGFESALSVRLARFAQDSKHQMVVVTAKTLNGQAVETYSLALANKLGIGREDANDGLMLLIAPNQRKARIEVGLGLESALTNEEAKRIMETDIIPSFSRGDYQAGIAAGVTSIIKETG